MEIKMYRDQPLQADELIGRIKDGGKVFTLESDEEKYIGWIDYDAGNVYDKADTLLGWIENHSAIVTRIEDNDVKIGYVTEDGEVFGYDEDENDVRLGRVDEMCEAIEGAAVLLLFFYSP
jgi:hypothetical protein